MYYGYRGDGSIMFASEMKCLHDQCPSFQALSVDLDGFDLTCRSDATF